MTEQHNLPHPDKMQKEFAELINALEKGLELPHDSIRDFLHHMVECSDLVGNDNFKQTIAEFREICQKLGFNDEDTDEDTPSASATIAQQLLKSLAKVGSGLLTLYRIGDAVLRFPENKKKVEEYWVKYQTRTTTPNTGEITGSVGQSSTDLVNGSTAPCSATDLSQVKEFLEASQNFQKNWSHSG